MISLPSSVYSFTPYPTFLMYTDLSLVIILALGFFFFSVAVVFLPVYLPRLSCHPLNHNVPWFPCFLLFSCLSPVWGNPSFSSLCKQIFPANSLAKLNVPFNDFHVLLMCLYQRNQSFCVVVICFYLSLSSLKDLLAQKCCIGHLKETLLLVKLLVYSSSSSGYSITAWGINTRDGY